MRRRRAGGERFSLLESVALILVGLGAFGGGCFTPRDPPPPCVTCPTPAPFKEPIIPEFVRDNIEGSLERPTIDPNYKDSLSDLGAGSLGFLYIPDAGAEAAATPGFFQGWDKSREVQFMLNLLEAGAAPQSTDMLFTMYEDTGELQGTNELRYEVHYEFTLTYVIGDSTEVECYAARAFWDLEGGDRNFWTLTKWEDLEPLPNPSGPCEGTMGLLRALSGQGS
jgi:hypothetical protein